MTDPLQHASTRDLAAWGPVLRAGNLTSRQDLRQGLLESFGYDAIGNLTSKTCIAGTFTYHPTRRHAVTSAGGTR